MNAVNPVASAARSWRAVLMVSLLALAPAQATGQPKPSDVKTADPVKARDDRILTLEVSLQDFIELQRLDDGERRLRLGLPASCSPNLTATTRSISPSNHLLVLVTCSPSD